MSKVSLKEYQAAHGIKSVAFDLNILRYGRAR